MKMKHLAIFIASLSLISCSPGGSEDQKNAMESGLSAEENVSALVVEVKEMIPEPIYRYFEANGHMEAIQDAYISPETSGQIKMVAIQRGARVRKGDLLIELNTDINEKSIAEVMTGLELATKIYEKRKELWEQQIGSEIQFLEAKNGKESLEARLATLQKQLDLAHVKAPFAGIVDDILVQEGELASPGIRLMRLVNLKAMRVSARISEAYLNSVKKGDQVELYFPTYPGEIVTARITRLGEVIDQVTRTFVIEIALQNKDEKYKPNMLTTVKVVDYTNDEALVVPSILLKQDFKGTFLFRVIEAGNKSAAEKVYVSTGITVQDQTMITEGLQPEDKVVTKGYNLVGDGSLVKIINK